jgi:hypothetical protein
MINLEISITLTTMLIAFFIVLYLLQRSGSRSRKVAQDKETLRLAKSLNCDTRDNANQVLMGLPPFFIKSEKADAISGESRAVVIVGLLIFVVFLGLAGYLLNIGFIEPAALTFAFGLGCVLLLVYAKRKILQGKSEVERLRIAVQQYESHLITSGKRINRKGEQADKPINYDGFGLNQLLELAAGCELVPQDSTLKRHFLSHILAQVSADLPPRPTDSALKRHYDTLLRTKVEQYLAVGRTELGVHEIGATQASSAKTVQTAEPVLSMSKDSVSKPNIGLMVNNLQGHEVLEHVPEDATLRRHFLTQLRMKIEAKLPPKPTDCNLLRHYRTLVQSMLDRELEEHYYF